MTYEQIVPKYSQGFRAYLLSRSVEPGEKVAIMMPNLLQYPIALFGLAGRIDRGRTPIHCTRPGKWSTSSKILEPQLSSLLKTSRPTCKRSSQYRHQNGDHHQHRRVLGFPKKVVVNFVVRSLKRMVPKYQILNTVSFTEALAQGKKFQIPPQYRQIRRCNRIAIYRRYHREYPKAQCSPMATW